jgi:8-oxo-dGTP diphosphatase
MKSRQIAVYLLYDEQKRILLQERTDDSPSFPGQWSFFGRRIEEGESPEKAVKREALEEVNASLEDPIFVLKVNPGHPPADYGLHVFVEKCRDKSSLRLMEGKGWDWFTLEEASELDLPSQDKTALHYLQENNQLFI